MHGITLPSSNACGGFIDVAKETRERSDLNYTTFVPATININDRDRNRLLVQIAEGTWLIIERNPRIHGTFSRQAAVSFDEFNPRAE